MNDKFEVYYSTPSGLSSTVPGHVGFDSAGPWLWTSQIREVLGADGELDPRTLEESWASGLPVSLDAFGIRRDTVSASDVRSIPVADLNDFGSFTFAQASQRSKGQIDWVHPSSAANSYAANWLHDPLERGPSAQPAQAETAGSTDCRGQASANGRLRMMTRQGACDVLCVGEDSSETQIKAAYRRMVSAWHPDRLEQSDVSVRAFATEQMAAINQAYRFLQETASSGVHC